VIAVNNAYTIAPWAEMCYFADARWWEWHKDKPEFRAFRGQKVTIFNTGMMVRDPAVFMLEQAGTDGLSLSPRALSTGSNGGYQAINIATLAGARRVMLLGYDMRFAGPRSHWHAGHPIYVVEQRYHQYAARFVSMVPVLKSIGVEVVNCTPGSMIKCFRMSRIKDEL
jgi:hypothetical protein